jgi:uncharacterized protein YecE (DUF72 family)
VKQLGLFGDDPPAKDAKKARREPPSPAELAALWTEERKLADRMPAHVRLGTSSWTFPGWGGLCYPGTPTERELIDHGLAMYAGYPLFGTVGIDRSYYGPLTEPELERYASQLPPGFPCVMKAWSGITTALDHRTREPIATYLDPAAAIAMVIDPIRRAFADHMGSLVFEFPPFRPGECPLAERFAEDLHRFFSALPADVPYSVEIRNRELLSRPYLEALRSVSVGHVINLWEAMPDVGDQMALPGIDTGPSIVSRLLLRPGTRYGERREEMLPFDRIRDENPKMRADVVRLARLAEAVKKVLFVLVNNKAEGCSPLTVKALATRLAR